MSKEERLPGSTLKIEEAIPRAEIIVVGVLVNGGSPEPLAPGQAYYTNVQIKVVKALKGAVVGEIVTSFNVQTLPKEKAEMPPESGKEYIFFIKKDNAAQFHILKVIASTPDNIKKVRPIP